MRPQDTIDFQLRWGWQKLARFYSSEAESRGIPFSYVFVLLQIDRDGTPSTKLGPRMGMESTSLSRTLKGMENMGLIERRPSEVDRRSVRVFLTSDGVDARRQARDLVVDVNLQLRKILGDGRVDRLLTEMKRLNEVLDRPEQLQQNLTTNISSKSTTNP
ncbi:MAG: MarR family winged helix-turn-helix transcriptional regulator [Flavobacteriales bacterium]